MKNETKQERVRINVTLDEYESKLFREAINVGFTCPSNEGFSHDKRRLLMLALLAFCRAVIADQQKLALLCPMVAELRKETDAEYKARIAGDIEPPPFDFEQRSRWN